MRYYFAPLLILFFLLNSKKENFDKINISVDTEETLGVRCGNFNSRGVQRCVAGIDSSILNVVANKTQLKSQWCWAASIEAVFNYYGYNITQEDIVYQAWGTLRNNSGSRQDILRALNRTYVDRNGRSFRASATEYYSNPITAAQDLANDRPLIIGTLGHAMVLTAVEYDRDAYGNGQVVNATVRDPWPTHPRRRRNLSSKEWHSTNLLIRINID
ncbi:papain-like cysteine protease family protein [Marinirhabdus gelatinilytica]|uniref:Papain like cysteine protease AvrRpt2 n=1 Tax=Marinirhabdus gelatinilytica TaxID=1703343 RepID=A0A370QA44_9FLAO|nr:papain-like cysteine protease family protein [Marinirhabdus gelatinilytica]RDK85233.1 papain like cysteine protease AvrRpt2 [Marinirhabdus gelatinilytica]